MIKHIVIALCALTIISAQAQNTKNAASKIAEVTVFFDGAQINREASVDLAQGTTILNFNKLSPFIDFRTIQVKAPTGVTISAVKFQKNYIENSEYSEEIKTLTTKIENLDNEINIQTTNQSAVDAEISFLQENKAVAKGNTNINVAALRETYNFYGEKMKSLLMKSLELKNKIAELKKQKEQYQRQLNQSLKAKQENQGEILVTVNAKNACKANFTLTYMVFKASWTPTYDIRVSDVGKPLTITYKANINQQTLVDWTNVKLKLSSAETTVSGAAPQLKPYYLDYPKVTIRNNYKSRTLGKSSAARTMLDVEADETTALYIPEIQEIEEEAPVTRNSYKPQQTGIQTAVEFEIKSKYTIKSGSNDEVVEMVEYSIPSEYQYVCIPKLNKNVYLTAAFTDWQQYNMLVGDANIYFEGTYVGSSILDTEQYSDTLKISLGVDKSISVKRENIKDVSKRQFIGTKRSETRDWKITAKNNKQQKINLTIYDQVPISKNTDIEVTLNEKSNGQQNPENGTIEWRFDLEPNAQKELRLNYTVKYSKNKSLNVE